MWLAVSWHYIVTPTQTVNNSTFWHANRLKTHQLNPTSIQPALILGAFFQISFFSKLKRQQCRLVNVRPVWSPRFFGPALTFCWAKNKVHRVHTESFAALIPRKWNFTPNPKQTRPHISLHYLNELFEYKKSYQVDIQCTLPCVFRKSYLLIQENKKKSELCESVSAGRSQQGHLRICTVERSLSVSVWNDVI